jgi:hypothetical protein
MKDRGEDYGLPTVRGPLFDAGPFDGSPNTPTPDEVLVGGLIWRHTGRANPISIAHIHTLTGYSERQIKGIVEQLVVTHRLRIGAKREEPAGYFMIQDGADQAAAVGPYRSQILSMWKRLRVLESQQGLRELQGQLKLEE